MITISGRLSRIISSIAPRCSRKSGMHSRHAAGLCSGSTIFKGVNGYRSGFVSCHAEMDACMSFARTNGMYELLKYFGDSKSQIYTRQSDGRAENLFKVAEAEV